MDVKMIFWLLIALLIPPNFTFSIIGNLLTGRLGETATSSSDGAAESFNFPDIGSIGCIVSTFQEVFNLTSRLNIQNCIIFTFINLTTEGGSEVTVLSIDAAVDSLHHSDIGFKYIFRCWESNVLPCLFTPTRIHRIESLGPFDLCSQREHSSLCSTIQFMPPIRGTPSYKYTHNSLKLLQLLGGLCLHRRCRPLNNLINILEKINPIYITSRKEEKPPSALMFTSTLTLINIALMLMHMHEIFLILTYIISIQLYNGLCLHWRHRTLHGIFKRVMSILILIHRLLLTLIYMILLQPFVGLCSHWAYRTICGVLFIFKRVTSMLMLMHTSSKMLNSAPQINLELHSQRKSKKLYGELEKTLMYMLMHKNPFMLSYLKFRQLCLDLDFHWENRALYSPKSDNHGMTSLFMPMHEMHEIHEKLLNKIIYIVSQLCFALHFYKKGSMERNSLTINGKTALIFMLMHRIFVYPILYIELWPYFNLYSHGISYIISRLQFMMCLHRGSIMRCNSVMIFENLTVMFMLMHGIFSYSILYIELWLCFNVDPHREYGKLCKGMLPKNQKVSMLTFINRACLHSIYYGQIWSCCMLRLQKRGNISYELIKEFKRRMTSLLTIMHDVFNQVTSASSLGFSLRTRHFMRCFKNLSKSFIFILKKATSMLMHIFSTCLTYPFKLQIYVRMCISQSNIECDAYSSLALMLTPVLLYIQNKILSPENLSFDNLNIFLKEMPLQTAHHEDSYTQY